MPEHVAIIMDGNGRWAQRHGKSRLEGHRQGVENVRRIVKASRNLGIQHITLYAFSVENWKRPKSEVSALMSLLNIYLKKELEELLQNGVRLNVIGRIEDLPKNVQKTLLDTIEKTKENSQQILTLALNYGARTEILDAVAKYTSLVAAGKEDSAELDWETFSSCLYTHNLPDPDLIIRTSGEHRLSNFLLLQAAYAEIYFTQLCWPEFLPEHLLEAIEDYNSRERRYGQTGEQIKEVKKSISPA
ncbi:MAG: isoprenyl transferase [Opitutae bacterium]|nr:isoprenyl transferase [Opitutae bacterium]MBT5381188.1 isoprenyl transferase [Opitutae bacterium]MBT6462547.1 isoprenyl transferase [Opitutae bacterium]MBT7852178.1 isoprenyl transferase [Opitutae bacterium]